MMMAVIPRRRLMSLMSERMDSVVAGSRAEVGLVAQEDLGVGSQSAGDGDALLLPAESCDG